MSTTSSHRNTQTRRALNAVVDAARFRRRVRMVLALGLLGLGIVAAQTAHLQIGQYQDFSAMASKEYLKDIRIPAKRGLIVDRGGHDLARSTPVSSVYANPTEVIDARETARTVSKILDVDLDTIYRRLGSERLFVWIKRHVDNPETEEKLKALKLKGIYFTQETRRRYPNRELAGHLLGFTSLDSKGLAGIEKSLDEHLVGEPQIVAAMRDGRGRSVLSGNLDPQHRSVGADVRISIDMHIQHAAEEAIADAMREFKAKSAHAVVLDVQTAEILAVAVNPYFNPNEAGKSKPGNRRNRAFVDFYEPASTFKPLVIAAALDAGSIKSSDKIDCENGALKIGTHTIRDGHPHSWLDLETIIQKSSNIGAAKIGQLMGRKKLYGYLHDYGFGQRTSMPFPGQSRGLLRPPSKWSDVGLATISFGHGVAVTGIQLAAAYRVLAAKGMYREPSLIQAITHHAAGGKEFSIELPKKRERRVLDAEVAEEVLGMMESVIKPEGTGWRAAVEGYRVAGKTGTAQKIDPVTGGYSSDLFVAVFGGIIPADDPRVVIIVTLDEPQGLHQGGQVAAPAFAKIAKAAMQILHVPARTTSVGNALQRLRGVTARMAAHNAELEQTMPPKPSDSAAGTLPSFVGLTARQAVEQFGERALGMELEFEGVGRVIRQNPTAGSALEVGQRLKLTLAM